MKMKTNKKPDLKTESLEVIKRVGGIPTPEEFIVKVKGNEKLENSEDELIIYQDDKIQISSLGFKKIFKNNKFMFAYQLRGNEGICIIHTEQNLEAIKDVLENLIQNTNFEFMSSQEYISPILNEIGTLININKQKGEEK
jgi:hypothetical protein